MKYRLTDINCVIRLEDNAWIPHDPANKDYIEYLKWLEQGNEPLPAISPETVDLTPAEKLTAAGLTVDDLKELLGLK